jgi:hypothetical protein
MARHLLFARPVGGRQRDTTDRLDLFELGGVIVAGGQGATMHTEGVFGIVGAQVGRPVVEVFLAHDGDWGRRRGKGGEGEKRGEKGRRRRDEARETGIMMAIVWSICMEYGVWETDYLVDFLVPF